MEHFTLALDFIIGRFATEGKFRAWRQAFRRRSFATGLRLTPLGPFATIARVAEVAELADAHG
jgi:hypothetical protein